MVERDHPALSLNRQCRLLSIGRSSLYYEPKGESAETLALMRRIDELFVKYPFYGARQMVRHLRREGVRIGRCRAARLMRLLGLQAVYRALRTSDQHPEHRVWPWLLKGLRIERANHVRCADITCIPVQRGFLYLAAIMDWTSRHILAWRLSNTLDEGFCTDALEEALARYGRPEIFNTDQGSQFTGFAFTGRLQAPGIRISMDGRGRCMDNIFIERLWRSLKYEAVYLHEIADGFTARRVIGEWIGFYNTVRPHSALGGRTPAEAYRGDTPVDMMDKRASRLDHIPTGATAATGRAIQGDSGGLNFKRDTPWPSRQAVRKGEATSGPWRCGRYGQSCQPQNATVRKAIRNAGAHLLFLPPYSPDLNPIEQVFAKLKHLLRDAAERTAETTGQRIGAILDRFPPHECANYIQNAGYASV